jgi:cytochrome c oxidase assembly protein subunit 15
MRALAIISLLFVLVLILVSTYSRLDSAGIGCADWPACYGLIGDAGGNTPVLGGMVEPLVAGGLLLLMLATTLVSLRQRRDRLLSLVLLGLTVFLVWRGVYSGELHSPAVVMGNLSGGFALLGLLGWMIFRDARPHANASHNVRRWVVAALVLLCIQIALGGLTSANFAATACTSLPDCHGSWLPGSDLATAFDLSRQHEIGPTGLALGGAERADIHKLHRLVAAATLLTALIAGGLALAGRMGMTAVFVIALAALEFSIGVAAIRLDLPIGLAVAHNLLAAILLLGLLRLHALCRNRQALL